MKTKARDSFDMNQVLTVDTDALHVNSNSDIRSNDEIEVILVRDDVKGIMV